MNRLQTNLIPSGNANIDGGMTQEEIINDLIIKSGRSFIENIANMGFVIDDDLIHTAENAFSLIGAGMKKIYGMEDEYEDLISAISDSHLVPLEFYPEDLE